MKVSYLLTCSALLALACGSLLVTPCSGKPKLKAKASAATSGSTTTITIDPCSVASPQQLKALLQAGLEQFFPYQKNHKGEHFRISKPSVREVRCPGTRVAIRADVKYWKTRGFPQFSTSGKIRLTGKAMIRVTLQGSEILHAEACFVDIKVVSLNLKRVPNWLDNTVLRQELNKRIMHKKCVDVTNLVKQYVKNGGQLK